MDARMYLVTLTLLSFFLCPNAAPIHSEMTDDFPLDRECFYQTQYYPHGSSIETEEPCLNCTCNKGVLVCFLRVCHNLVAPQDSDCQVRKSEGQCCAEMVCGAKDLGGIVGNATQSADVTTPTPRLSDQPLASTAWWTSSERSSDDTTLSPAEFIVQDNAVKSGCRYNGSIYAEGSAMPSSTFCEYCYCIKGHQRCIKPQCHLHIDECKPIYRHEFSCCPTAYACSKKMLDFTSTPSTTTVASEFERKWQDCRVNGTTHKEGDVVFSKDVCENCFCVKGVVRCSTTTCALNMEGCQPIIQPGKCCPTGYNCTLSPTTEGPQELENSLTGSTTDSALQQSPITSYFDNIISSTDNSVTESQETAYESRTAMDTLPINDTDTENDTIAARDNDRNILEADALVATTVATEDALVATTVATEDASLNASEIVSSTPESTESNELGGTAVGEDETEESSGRYRLQATSDRPAETEDPPSSTPVAAEEPTVSNVTKDIAEERTYAVDVTEVNTNLSEIPQSLNNSAEDEAGFTNDTILQSKAAVTDFIPPTVNETLSDAETNSTEEYTSNNASEAVASLLDRESQINTTAVNATAITPLNDDVNETTSVIDKEAGVATNSSDFEVKAKPEHNASGNATASVTIEPNNANETNILEDRSDIITSTTEVTVLAETTIQSWNSSSINSPTNVTNLDDSINNHSIIQRTDIADKVIKVNETEEEDEIDVPNAFFGGIHEGVNTTLNINKTAYKHGTEVTASNISSTNNTNTDVEILEVATVSAEENSNNESSVDSQFDRENKTEPASLPHQLQDAVPLGGSQDSNLTRLTDATSGYDVEENQTIITNSSESDDSTAHESSSISENATQSLNDTTFLPLTYKTPPKLHINNASSQSAVAEESNITATFADNAVNEAIYRQAVKGSSNISNFEAESIPAVHLSLNSNQHITSTDKATPTDRPNESMQVTKIPSDQLLDPYEAQASNETLVFKPVPVPSNSTNALLGSFSSIVSSLLKQEDNGSSTTAHAVKETELIHPNLSESFDVLLEDLVGEYPGEVQFNTISYLNFNNDVATVSTTAISQDSSAHTPEQEAIPSNETRPTGENEAMVVVNGSHEAPDRLQEQSDFFSINATGEDKLKVETPDEKNGSKTIENITDGNKQHNNAAATTESQTKSSIADSDLEVNETKSEPTSSNQSVVEEATSGHTYSMTTNIPPKFSELNQTFGRNPDEEMANVTKFDETTDESTTEKETDLSTTPGILNFTYKSDIFEEKNEENISDVNASTVQPDTHQTTTSTSMLFTTLHSNTAQDASTQITTGNAEVNPHDTIPGSQVSHSNSPAVLHLGNETQGIPTESSPPKTEISFDTDASATRKPDGADEPTTVESQNEFPHHADSFDISLDDHVTLASASATEEYQRNSTGSDVLTPETSTIEEDLDDTLEMILNLSKTYALTHPRPSSQNTSDEELLSGTLPSEVEAKIAEIIRQAQAGLINGKTPPLHFNRTVPHFAYEENDGYNSTADIGRHPPGTSNLSSSNSDYEYDDGHESQPPVPTGLLAQIGGLFNSSWSSHIGDDIHRDTFQKPPEVSKEPPSNESIVHDLHQMFIPLVELTEEVNTTDAASTGSSAFVTPADDRKFHDASTPLPNGAPLSSQPASTIPGEVDFELTTLFPREFIKEVYGQKETQSPDDEFFNEEDKIGSSAIGADDAHHQLASTELSTHSIQHQPETHTTEHVVDESDPWQHHGDSQDGGGHFTHDNDDSYKDHAHDNHPSFEGVQGDSDNEDVFSHAVAADEDEKSYFSADDFETGATRHEVENSGEVSAADSKLSVDEINVKEDSEHNDALLETTHLDEEPSSIGDWQDEQVKQDHQPHSDSAHPELFETVSSTTPRSPANDISKTTQEAPQRSPTTTPSNHQEEVEALPREETEAPEIASAEKSAVTKSVSEERIAEAITEPVTTPAILEVLNAKTTDAAARDTETTTQAFTTKAFHDIAKSEAAPETAETEAPHRYESAVDEAWLDLGDDDTSRLEKRSTTAYPSTTARNIPSDAATNFFSTLSNFFSQAIANAGLHQGNNKHDQNKADSTDVPESDSNQSIFGSDGTESIYDGQQQETAAAQDTKSAEDHDFPETGFLRKDAAGSGHHALITEVASTENRNPQHHYPGSEPLLQPTQASNQYPSEGSPKLHSFVDPDPQGDHDRHISEEEAPEVHQSAFVASEVLTTPDPNAFVGLVSKGSIVFENVLPLSRRGRPTTDERTGQALPTPRKSSAIDNGSTEESALVPEDVRVIPFLPEDAITDELHQEPVKPNLAPRNEDKDAIPAAGEVEPITRMPQAQDLSSVNVRVSATSSFQVDDAAGHEETGSVGIAVPISPDGEEFVPVTVATSRTATTSATVEASSDLQDHSTTTTTLQPSSAVTEARIVPTSTVQKAEPTTSPTADPELLSADAVIEDADRLSAHHVTEPTHEAAPRTQSTRTNKNDDQGIFNIQSAPSFQQTPDYCVEEGEVFQDGERIPTADFCAQCRCNSGEMKCQHVSCPQRPPGCIEKVMPSSCCPAFLCNETGLIQDGDSGLPLRSGITIHGGFVPIERPVVPHEQHRPAFEDTKSHAEVPSAEETHGHEHAQSHQGTEVTEAGGHAFGSEVEGHGTAPAEQTVAPKTPDPQPQDPHPSQVSEEPHRGPTTESSGIFEGLLESVFGGKDTQGSPAGPGGEETAAEAEEPEVHAVDRTGLDEKQEAPPTTSTSGPTTTKLVARGTTAESPPTEGTSTKAPEATAGLWPMLKVSSCNIYGRVYQVGSKIGVLSGPCKECKCTSGGVECYRIKCF